MRSPITQLSLALLAAAQPLAAQVPVQLGSPLDDYARLVALRDSTAEGPLIFRSPSALTVSDTVDAHPWAGRYPAARPTTRALEIGPVTLLPIAPDAQVIHNSQYPWGSNDGVLWAGAGLTTALSGGGRARWGPASATFLPTIYRSANGDFPLAEASFADRPAYAYPWSPNIDWPQRFGAEGFGDFDWGQSEFRLDLGAFTAAFSHENLWWGPAMRGPLVMSNDAGGFPHLDIGTGRPVSIGIGRLEVRGVWGALEESAYFDTVANNGRRFFRGMTLGYQPSFIPGLTVGFTRTFNMRWDDSVTTRDYFRFLETVFKWARITEDNPRGEDIDDQLLSLIVRWRAPDAGFEAYAEWARNDHSGDLRDFILEPDHSRAYTLGFQKAFGDSAVWWRLRGEWTQLERSRTLSVRASPPYYAHHIVTQGYTHRGQLLGAAIGPGSSSQLVALDRFDRRGRLGVFGQWVRRDNDAYYARFADSLARTGHDVELTAGISAVRFVHDLDIALTLAVSRNLNRYFVVNNDVTNLHMALNVQWRIR